MLFRIGDPLQVGLSVYHFARMYITKSVNFVCTYVKKSRFLVNRYIDSPIFSKLLLFEMLFVLYQGMSIFIKINILLLSYVSVNPFILILIKQLILKTEIYHTYHFTT